MNTLNHNSNSFLKLTSEMHTVYEDSDTVKALSSMCGYVYVGVGVGVGVGVCVCVGDVCVSLV